MAPKTSNATAEFQIRALIEDWVRASQDRDVDGCLAKVAPDVLLFDVVNPLRYTGADSERRRLEEWFSQFEDGPIGYEVRDLAVVASDDVAFCHSLNHVSATTPARQPIDMWWRATMCFRKVDGEWLITHEHNSVPLDPKTGLASLGLVP